MIYFFRKMLLVISLLVLGAINVNAAESVEGSLVISTDPLVGVPISGVIDDAAKTISIGGFIYQGSPFTVVSGEYLLPGTYYRNLVTETSTFSRYAVISEGNVGGYFVMSWGGVQFSIFMQWDHDPILHTYTNIPFFGNTIRQGPLKGNDLTIDLGASDQSPFVNSTIIINDGVVVDGTNRQECTEPAGAMVSFNVTASMNEGAIISSVDWALDELPMPETGTNASILAGLGSHTVEAIVTTSMGVSHSASTVFDVVDTAAPSLDVFFIDSSGQPVTSATAGDVDIQFVAEDICDLSPIVKNGGAVPIMNVVSGDQIRVVQQDGNVIIPTTGVRVTATAQDAAGNGRTSSSILIIE